MRRALLLSLLAAAQAENCGGSLSVDPRYCVKANPATGQFYCQSSGVNEGDIVPLRVRVRNRASYDIFGEEVWVPGAHNEPPLPPCRRGPRCGCLPAWPLSRNTVHQRAAPPRPSVAHAPAPSRAQASS